MPSMIVYDETCHGPRGPMGMRFPGLTTSWRLGASVYRTAGRFDHVIAARGWQRALDALLDAANGAAIDEIQFWCHGKWGQVFLDGDVLDVDALGASNALAPTLDRLSAALGGRHSLVWFRTCETFGGAAGQRFAEAIANRLRCRVAGHTYVIGPLQSGLHALDPGERAGWSDTEGLVEGTPAAPRRAAWSSPRAPRTISCLRSTLPDWAHDPLAPR